MGKRGFTLVELAFVLGLIGILVALSLPAFDEVLQRGRALEARATLEAIVHAEHAWRRDHGSYLALPGVPSEVPRGREVPFEPTAEWQQIGIRVEGPVRFRYEVVLDGTTFVAIARGDLDGDGQESEIRVRGDTFELVARDETE